MSRKPTGSLDTDRAWEEFGRRDPYFGVLSHSQFRREALTPANREEFFRSWVKGFVLTRAGRIEEGREALERSLELEPFPTRASRRYRGAVAQIAREENCDLIDIDPLFASRAAPALPIDLYRDGCHPSPLGHDAIATALIDKMKKPATR